MTKHYYSALIHQEFPPAVLSFLKGYIHIHQNQNFLICYEISDLGYFLEMTILPSVEDKTEWRVRVQTQYVLAIGELGDYGKFPLGFLS